MNSTLGATDGHSVGRLQKFFFSRPSDIHLRIILVIAAILFTAGAMSVGGHFLFPKSLSSFFSINSQHLLVMGAGVSAFSLLVGTGAFLLLRKKAIVSAKEVPQKVGEIPEKKAGKTVLYYQDQLESFPTNLPSKLKGTRATSIDDCRAATVIYVANFIGRDTSSLHYDQIRNVKQVASRIGILAIVPHTVRKLLSPKLQLSVPSEISFDGLSIPIARWDTTTTTIWGNPSKRQILLNSSEKVQTVSCIVD